ncbi:putative fructosyl amino acid oxidasesarcosine oxidase [Exophiala viscosa]|uniref:Fructosyl amino acid oxidasesarcosine oxidase n=1 Tax=Exophiala viscosa TaxID=2486360 RepID=A0AAN6IKS1_9EURO|nr:putative fructosyl amino acid oxidasesarcosine oxidase [Exophiala viscosa]KAI1627967.1 putative fructosyl amino acid oxidasesarcosine oxidase [Exophiala viscosa]
MSQRLPDSIIIVGAGIWGLSTALAIARRYPSIEITLVDRQTPPVEDGASVDTTRCIRADYADPVYTQLAEEAQKKIEEDPELVPFYFKQGMTFVCNGESRPILDFWKKGLENNKKSSNDRLVQMPTPESVYQRLHGQSAQLVPENILNEKRQWNLGYCNLDDAFIDAKECTRVYYERCLKYPSISFRCGVPVQRVCMSNGRTSGVLLEDGQTLSASQVLIAAGAWSNQLLYLEGLAVSNGIAVAWIKLTEDEIAKWKNMAITTNLDTGLNLFPPHNGEMKVLLRSIGYQNTVSIPHPEDASKKIQTSLPRTLLTNPTDVIPPQVEARLRDNLRELMPSLANRPFDRTKICWVSKTPSSDFIIAPHPAIEGLHVATGDSGHGWKFITTIGDMILDSMEGTLDKKLAERWAWAAKGPDNGAAPGVGGNPTELRHVVRSRL